jgi:hypothetical protein
MSCSDDGCGVSVKAIYIWANDDNSEWIDYVSHMQLHTDPDRRHKGKSSLFCNFASSIPCMANPFLLHCKRPSITRL